MSTSSASLRVGDELGGHMVSGHVDGVAEILTRRDFDGMAHFRFRAPKDLAKFIAVKGSVALDGTSLTVNAVDGDTFEVLLIPHTLKVTTWGERRRAIGSISRSTRWRATPRGSWRRGGEGLDGNSRRCARGCARWLRGDEAVDRRALRGNDPAILAQWLVNRRLATTIAVVIFGGTGTFPSLFHRITIFRQEYVRPEGRS